MITRFLLDTSCIIAAVCNWHPDHDTTAREIQRRLSAGEELVSAGPALVESYAVLTRLPAPHRLFPADALAVIESNFITRRRVIALDNREYLQLLRAAPARGIFGGRSYDAVIAECAVKSRAATLLTLNDEHFRLWHGEQLKVIVPSQNSHT